MVQRYRFNYVQEMFETETGEQHNETERGEWVKYSDYAALRKIASMLMENLSDDAKLPHETVELMMDLGVFDD